MSQSVSRPASWILPLAWMVLIFSGSTNVLSTHQTSRFLGPILRFLFPGTSASSIAEFQFFIRKTGHVTEYAILAVLLWRALRLNSQATGWNNRHAIIALTLAFLYAVTDEIHQYFVATRQASVWDVLLDTVGAAIGLALLYRLGKWRKWW